MPWMDSHNGVSCQYLTRAPQQLRSVFDDLFSLYRVPNLFVEPDMLETQVVVDRVLVLDMALEVGMPASRSDVMKDDRPRNILDQNAFDVPDHRLAFRRIGLLRLLIQQLVHLGVAVLREVGFRLTRKAHL